MLFEEYNETCIMQSCMQHYSVIFFKYRQNRISFTKIQTKYVREYYFEHVPANSIRFMLTIYNLLTVKIYLSGRLGANELKTAQIFYLVLPISKINKSNFCKIKILDLKEITGQNASRDSKFFSFDQSALIKTLKTEARF